MKGELKKINTKLLDKAIQDVLGKVLICVQSDCQECDKKLHMEPLSTTNEELKICSQCICEKIVKRSEV